MIFGVRPLLLVSACFGWVLLRISLRLGGAGFGPNRCGIVAFPHAQVVLGRNRCRVAEPEADDVDGEPFGELGLCRRPEVVPRPGPGLDPGSADDPLELRAKIHTRPAIAIREHELGAFGSVLKRPSEIVPPPGPMPNPTSPFQGPSGILPACGVEVLQVLRSYKDRLAGRPSHDTAKHAIQAWTEFLSLSGFRYVHGMTLTAQERFIQWRRPSRLTGLPNSNGTINRDLEVLRAAFYDAWRRGEIAAFPHVRLLPKPAPRDRFLTESEVQRLLDECADTPHLRLFCLVALHTLQRPPGD